EAWLEDDDGFDHFGADRVGDADDGGEGDGGVAGEAGFDLAGADAVAAAGDQVAVAADEAEVALLVGDAEIATDQPVAAELRRSGGVVAPVAEEHHRIGSLVRDAAHLAGRKLAALAVDDRDRMSRDGGPGPAGPHRRKRGAVADHQVALGLSVELVDRQSEGGAAP